MTNAQKIRAMSDEELAAFLERVHVDPCSACCDNLYWCRRNNAPEPVCKNHFLEWLQHFYCAYGRRKIETVLPTSDEKDESLEAEHD